MCLLQCQIDSRDHNLFFSLLNGALSICIKSSGLRNLLNGKENLYVYGQFRIPWVIWKSFNGVGAPEDVRIAHGNHFPTAVSFCTRNPCYHPIGCYGLHHTMTLLFPHSTGTSSLLIFSHLFSGWAGVRSGISWTGKDETEEWASKSKSTFT